MRVLIVCQPTEGGVAHFVETLCAAGTQAGHSVVVASPFAPEFVMKITKANGTHFRLELRRQPSPRDLLAVMKIARLAKDFDIVALQSSKAGILGRLAMRKSSTVIYSPHGWSYLMHSKLRSFYYLAEFSLFRRAKLHAVSVREAELAPVRKFSIPLP